MNFSVAIAKIPELQTLLDEYHTFNSEWSTRIKGLAANVKEPVLADNILVYFPAFMESTATNASRLTANQSRWSSIMAAMAAKWALEQAKLNEQFADAVAVDPNFVIPTYVHPGYLQAHFDTINNFIVSFIDTFISDHETVDNTMTTVVPGVLKKCAIVLSYKSNSELNALLDTPGTNSIMATLSTVTSDDPYDYVITIYDSLVRTTISTCDSQLSTLKNNFETNSSVIEAGSSTSYEDAHVAIENYTQEP